ncbi:MAG: RtcB family protein [Candidatus Dormibacteria bacterium]
MPERLTGNLLSWASDLDQVTRAQAEKIARSPALADYVALMPDAHLGIGATIGTVLPTATAIIPSAVGVDIGCGMAAVETDLLEADLPDDLSRVLDHWGASIPSGVGQGHGRAHPDFADWLTGQIQIELDQDQLARAAEQFGTLGSGNHFVEVAVDERERVWVLLHSGSRGVGNQLAQAAIKEAKDLCRRWLIPLEDPDLAYFVQGDPAFDRYIARLRWSQAYAAANRSRIGLAAVAGLLEVVGKGRVTDEINCHHNYTELEHHHGKNLWITRKGAIRARVGDRGLIPGSMGTSSYVVGGLGNEASYQSCAHGAGRRLSRGQARRQISGDDLRRQMAGRTWLERRASELVDEAPGAYKDIDQVMADQADLVRILHQLRSVVNYKGL